MKTQWINEEGIVLQEGMKVSGYIICSNKWGNTYDIYIEGIIVKKNKKLYVNSYNEPHKFYLLGKFANNFISKPNVSYLKILN